MQAAGQKRAVAGTRRKSKGTQAAQDRDVASLIREAERLRDELAQERKRVKSLEDANSSVAERLDVAIESVKTILARQG